MSVAGTESAGAPLRLILASASPRRCELLEAAGYDFEVCPAGVEEVNPDYCSARETVFWNALRKARAVAGMYPEAVVIGADTLVAFGGRVYGKPANLPEARRMLAALSGSTHAVFTAVAVLQEGGRRREGFVDRALVTFRKVNTEEIALYIEDVNPLDKAGAYGAQETSRVRLVDQIEGREDTVFGLPVGPLSVLLDGIPGILRRTEATLAHRVVPS